MKAFFVGLLFLLVVLFLVSGCSQASGGGPVEVVEQYLAALADQDKELLVNSSCKSWEEQAALEVDALLSVGSEVKDLSCQVAGEEGDFTLVKCSGVLDLTYNEEIRTIDLGRRTYQTKKEEGQWRVCSYN